MCVGEMGDHFVYSATSTKLNGIVVTWTLDKKNNWKFKKFTIFLNENRYNTVLIMFKQCDIV